MPTCYPATALAVNAPAPNNSGAAPILSDAAAGLSSALASSASLRTGEKQRPQSDAPPLPSRLASVYRWLCKLSEAEGYCWACTGYLARKQGTTERTVYRWLARLRSLGYIATEQTPGVERRVRPLLPPSPPRPSRISYKDTHGATHRAGVCQGKLSGVLPYKSSDARKNTTTCQPAPVQPVEPVQPVPAANVPEGDAVQAAPAIVGLVRAGVSWCMASHLVKKHGEQAVMQQVEALPFRNVRDRAAALVCSVRQSWQVPGALLEAQREAQEKARKAAQMAAGAARQAERAECRQRAEKRLLGLSEAQREALEQQARAALTTELPAAARLMLGSRAGAVLVRTRMLALLGGPEPAR